MTDSPVPTATAELPPLTSREPAADNAPDSPRAATPQRVAAGGFRLFLIVWFGQLISLVGSSLTGFALGVWVYQRTGSVTQFSLISLFTTLPGIILSPVAGALVDRWDRRWAMVLSDSGAALATLTIAVLLYLNRLPLWYVYVAMTASSTFSAVQWPAYTAATTLLVPKRHLGRAAGLRNLSQSAANLVAPVLGGILLLAIGIHGVILIDFATFLFAVSTLMLVRIPRPEESAEARQAKGSIWREAGYGWSYVRARQGLFGLLVFSALANLALGLVQVLAPPMVLAFGTAAQLGTALSIAGAGFLAGSLLTSVWGGLRRKIDGILVFSTLCGVSILAVGLRPSLVLFTAAAFLFYFAYAVSGAAGQALWQVKVAPDVQGRVFAIRRLVGWSTFPLAYLCAGPLADHLFTPLLMPGGALAGSLGAVLGTGKGRGIGLLLVLNGLFLAVVSVGAYLFPRVRRIEQELPDMISD